MSEVFLSNIRRSFRIKIGSHERLFRVKLIDLIIGTLEVDYPPITQLIFQTFPGVNPFPQREEFAQLRTPFSFTISWDRLEELQWSNREIRVSELSAIKKTDAEEIVKSVLLVRDILDAFIIDLQNQRVTRANDLLLEDSGVLCLQAADTSVRGLLRRLSRGLYQGFRKNELQDWKYVEFLRGEPGAIQAGKDYHRRITRLPPGEIASLAERLPYLHAAELVLLLPHQLAADTMELMAAERQLQVFEELDEEYALQVIERMSPDIAADLIGQLTPDLARRFLDQLPKSSSERIVDLLRYPQDTVGGIMTNDMIVLPGKLTVAEARERLRTQLQEPDFVYFLYVVDNDENLQLRGVVTLRSVLVAKDDQRLEEIMNPYLETLSPLDPPRKAAYRLIKSQLAALPVAAQDGRIVGVVTVDMAVSLVAPNAWSSQAPRVFS